MHASGLRGSLQLCVSEMVHCFLLDQQVVSTEHAQLHTQLEPQEVAGANRLKEEQPEGGMTWGVVIVGGGCVGIVSGGCVGTLGMPMEMYVLAESQ